jgi:hypothetical protein
MVQRGCGERLLLEPSHAAAVIPERGGQELEGDLAAEAGVLSEVNLPHSAPAEQFRDAIVTEFPIDEGRACLFLGHRNPPGRFLLILASNPFRSPKQVDA